MINELYEQAAQFIEEDWVSDLHITVGEPIWVRTSGVLTQAAGADIVTDSDFRFFLVQLGGDLLTDPERAINKAEEVRSGGDERSGCDFAALLGKIRCRCNLSFANGGTLSVAIRRLNEQVPEFKQLGLPGNIIAQTENATGLILVTGPTGSGKSTTLASMLNHINMLESKHIITIEDPVEYLLPKGKCKITRKEIGKDCRSFISALRAAMRQDPDVIMVGEIRDIETMRAALTAAETGHLVLATLHTTSAVKTVDRVGSFFSPEDRPWAYSVFSSIFKCIVSQTLVPRIDGGRSLAYEVMMGSTDVRNNIKEGKINLVANSIAQGEQFGHSLMNKSFINLVREKKITREAAMAHAYDRENLSALLSQHGLK